MALGLGWKLYGDGRTLGPDEVVAPDERLSWGKTVGPGRPARRRDVRRDVRLPAGHGAQPPAGDHDERHRDDLLPAHRQGQGAQLPRHRASFVGGVAAIRAQGGDSADVTGAILVAGVGAGRSSACSIHFVGSGVLHTVLPPVVTGAVVMLIGFNLAPVVAGIYWPQDQWVALLTMIFMIVVRGRRCAASRPHRGLPRPGLRLPAVLAARPGLRPDHLRRSAAPREVDHALRVNWDGVPARAAGSASRRRPTSAPTARRSSAGTCPTFTLAVHPARAARRDRADRREHRPRQGGRRDDRRPTSTRTWAGRSPPTASAPCSPRAVGGSPTTTYAENIGVMAATRVYSTAAYYVAAAVAILFGLSPKFGALVVGDPGRRARRHHRRALRHDRPARREDLEGERGRLRQPDQPGADRRRHHHRASADVSSMFTDNFSLERHRARHHRGHRRLPPGPGDRPAELRDRADGASRRRAIAVGDHVLRRQRRRRRPRPGGLRRASRPAHPEPTSAVTRTQLMPRRGHATSPAERCLSPDPSKGRIAR